MPGLSEAFERVGAFLELRLPLTHAAGAALAVTDREETLGVVVRGFADAASGSPVRPETRFEIGSISKSFAAVVAVQEARAGRLDLHASVNDLVPWLRLPEPLGAITPHRLMTHSAGLIIGTEESPGGRGAIGILRGQPVGFAPGERFWYSNDGWKVLGVVLEQLTGRAIHDLIRQRVFEPLGMSASVAAITNDVRTDLATGYQTLFDDRPPRTQHPLVPAPWGVSNSADGSIVSNVLDMAAYGRMLLAGGEPLLDGEGFALLTLPVMEDRDWPTFRYGYGLWIGEEDGRRRFWHSGGMVGYTALLMVEPDDGLAAVMLLNGSGARRETVRFALDCARTAFAGRDAPAVVAPPAPNIVPDGASFAGRYRGDARTIEVRVAGPELRVVEGEREARLDRADEAPDVFLVDDPELDRWPLRFGRGAGGRVVEVFWGDDWMVNERWSGAAPEPHPVRWEAFPGLYRSWNPWSPTLRVGLRKGQLVLQWSDDVSDGEEVLVPLEDGSFHVGTDEWTPSWIRFHDVVEGRATRAVFNGGTWYRSFEP